MRLTMLRVAVMLAFGVWSTAVAFGADDKRLCEAADDRAIAACTRLLASKTLVDAERALIYLSRGSAYRQGKDYAHALADLSKAIELLEKSSSSQVTASIYVVRAGVYAEKGDYEKAVSDYNLALKLDPKNLQATDGIKLTEGAMGAVPAPPTSGPSTDSNPRNRTSNDQRSKCFSFNGERFCE